MGDWKICFVSGRLPDYLGELALIILMIYDCDCFKSLLLNCYVLLLIFFYIKPWPASSASSKWHKKYDQGKIDIATC